LAEALSITQRTLSFNEREAGDIPAGLAPPMARALGVFGGRIVGRDGEEETRDCRADRQNAPTV